MTWDRRIYPEWKMDANFLVTSYVKALKLDAKTSSHPIEVEGLDIAGALEVLATRLPRSLSI